MPPNEQDAAYLWDMLEAARSVARFVAGRTREQYLADELLQAAVERKIEIVGEAARKLSDALQQAHPEIPWSKVMGQRHVLAQDYGRIQHDRIWSVVTEHLPALVSQLESLLPSGEGEQ